MHVIANVITSQKDLCPSIFIISTQAHYTLIHYVHVIDGDECMRY